MQAVLLISHGSRSPVTINEVSSLVNELKVRTNIPIFEYAFLEVAEPGIERGIEICVQKGATEVVILVSFLNSGRHVSKDIPEIVESVRQKYPHVRFRLSQPIGLHKNIADLYIDLIDHA